MTYTYKKVIRRAAEGVLIYLNAFLLLDFTRVKFKDQPGTAVTVMLIATILIIYVLYQLYPLPDNGKSLNITAPIMIPPIPNTPAETFQFYHNRGAF